MTVQINLFITLLISLISIISGQEVDCDLTVSECTSKGCVDREDCSLEKMKALEVFCPSIVSDLAKFENCTAGILDRLRFFFPKSNDGSDEPNGNTFPNPGNTRFPTPGNTFPNPGNTRFPKPGNNGNTGFSTSGNTGFPTSGSPTSPTTQLKSAIATLIMDENWENDTTTLIRQLSSSSGLPQSYLSVLSSKLRNDGTYEVKVRFFAYNGKIGIFYAKEVQIEIEAVDHLEKLLTSSSTSNPNSNPNTNQSSSNFIGVSFIFTLLSTFLF